MAKELRTIHNEVFICNTVFTGNSGQPQAVACRMRGETNGKTIKVAPHLFGKSLPLPGEVIYVSSGEIEDDASNYRTMRNGKLSIDSPEQPSAPHPAEDPIF